MNENNNSELNNNNTINSNNNMLNGNIPLNNAEIPVQNQNTINTIPNINIGTNMVENQNINPSTNAFQNNPNNMMQESTINSTLAVTKKKSNIVLIIIILLLVLGGITGAYFILKPSDISKPSSTTNSNKNNSKKSKENNLVVLPTGRTKNNLKVGDEICVNGDTTECFNFIGYDGNNIKMLSKWNLNVGSYAKGTVTNLQDSDVRGSGSSGAKYGTVAFSGTNYWYDGSSLKAKYGSAWDTNNIYDTDYSDASGTNYSVAYYVENYKDTLETYGLTVQEARLLTYREATDSSIGCDKSSYSCPTDGFITNTSFWLGSALSTDSVWFVRSGGGFDFGGYYGVYSFGVRPVVVISKSDI